VLECREVLAGYKKLRILHGVSLQATEGKITVVVGPNGSGKSTLLKSISGLATVFGGTIQLDGLVLSNMSPKDIARSGIAYLPQTENVFTNLTVKENLRISGYMLEQDEYEKRLESSLSHFPQLNQYIESKVSGLSGGERQMLAMAMALIREPTVMMFDEPTANLSPKLAAQVLETIVTLTREMNMTTVLVEQNTRKALEIGDQAVLLVSGKKVFDGDCKELLSHADLARMYLGLKAS
jgi:branched-chain amino acid transport system ATP-binding protein